jgi:hypothetical protein
MHFNSTVFKNAPLSTSTASVFGDGAAGIGAATAAN